EFVAAEQRPLVADAVARVLAGAAAVELETRGAESERWFRARIAGIREQGVITGLVVHVQDVDDAKSVALERDMLRARLRQAATNATAAAGDAETAQRRLDLMADALPVLISYVDAAHRYQYNNAAYTRWFGTSQD